MRLTNRGQFLLVVLGVVFGLALGFGLPNDPWNAVPDQVEYQVYDSIVFAPEEVEISYTSKQYQRRIFATDYHRYAYDQLFKRSTEREYACLKLLWQKESEWSPLAQNPTSTAYGIAQFLDQTWHDMGLEKTDNAYLQIEAGLLYIDKRYDGSPCMAWEFHQLNGWY